MRSGVGRERSAGDPDMSPPVVATFSLPIGSRNPTSRAPIERRIRQLAISIGRAPSPTRLVMRK